MRTKAVYVLICTEQAIYAEQAWCSIWSLKHFTPEAKVTIVTDKPTLANLQQGYRKEMMRLVDEVVTVEFDDDANNVYRSRWIKTNLRSLIHGDFVFIDTDTIITASIADIDNCQHDVAMVLDLHCPLTSHPHQRVLVERQRKVFGYKYDIQKAPNYYNSGVIYSKDTPRAHHFFENWHEAWKQSYQKSGLFIDQLPLVKALYDNPNSVGELNGVYNCQILCSLQYFNQAKIIHFFNSPWLGEPVSKFFTKEFYHGIQQAQGLNEDYQQQILSCKDSFTSPSFIIGPDAIQQLSDANDFLNFEWLKLYHRLPFLRKISDGIAYIADYLKKHFRN